MPEASVDEDCDTSAREDNVGTTADARNNNAVDSIAQAKPVKFPPERHFRLGVSPSLPLHSPQRFRRRCDRNRHHTLANVVSYSFAMRTMRLP